VTRAPLLLALVVTVAVGQAPIALVSTLVPPEGHVFEGSVLDDVNRDGRADLALLVASIQKPRTRHLAIHLRTPKEVSFHAKPDRTVNLTPDVTAFSFMDLGSEHGRDVVFFNRTGAWLRRAKGDRARRTEKILDVDFLWQLPDDSEALHWAAGVRDLDGDGLEDLVVPEPSAWRIAFQSRGEDGEPSFARTWTIPVPTDLAGQDTAPRGGVALRDRARGKALELRARGDGAEENARPLVAVTESVPAPQLADWDGDKDLDLIARTASQLHVWVQGEGKTFTAAPTYSFPIPVVVDRERQLDVSYSAHVIDLNGDDRADCVFIAGNRRAKEVRTQVLLYVQGAKGRGPASTTPEAPLFGPAGIPAMFLQLVGFAGFPQFDDINGDGRPDLSITTFRPDLIGAMGARAAKSLDIGWSIFINRNGSFGRRADVQSNLTLSASDLEGAEEFLLTRFLPDVNGDGLRDVLVQDAPRRIRLLGLRRQGRSITRAEKPLWKLTWGFEATVHAAASTSPHPEFVVRGHRKLLHVRLGS
jgi:hypothetical protein